MGRDCFASKGETMNAHASDKTRILALAAVATLGFGLLQGARLLDLNTGPYSPTPYALVGLAADGLTFLVVAVLSYLGRIDRAKPLFVAAVVVSSIYAVLVASGNTNDIALIAMQVLSLIHIYALLNRPASSGNVLSRMAVALFFKAVERSTSDSL